MNFSEDRYQQHKRQIAALMGQYHLRHLRRLYESFGGDLEMPLILGEVANRNIAQLVANNDFFPDGIDQQMIDGLADGNYLSCSAMSVSIATGLSRETARRKLNKLAANGFITKMPDSGFVITKKPMESFSENLNKELVSDLLATCAKIATLLNDSPPCDG
jgi:DNA-binding transcriptional regulator YhcF (GntR family)